MAPKKSDRPLAERQREYRARYREKHKDKIREYTKRPDIQAKRRERATTPEARQRQREYMTKYKSDPANLLKIRERDARWRNENIERKRQMDREYYAAHREDQNKKAAQRYAENPNYARNIGASRRDFLKRKWLLKCCHSTPGILQCQCPGCGVSDIDVLTFGHVRGDGARDRRENGTHFAHNLESGRKEVTDFETQCFQCNNLDDDLQMCPHKDHTAEEKYMQNTSKEMLASLENKELCIDHYTNGARKCAECGEPVTTWTATIDHVNADGNAHRRESGSGGVSLCRKIVSDFHETGLWMQNIRVTCWNCNLKTAVMKRREDLIRRNKGETIPMKIESHTIVPVCTKRRPGKPAGRPDRRNKLGFERYSTKDEMLRKGQLAQVVVLFMAKGLLPPMAEVRARIRQESVHAA